eukprot:SAG22_NODE_5013_length_1108_cov_0.790882_2_plen_119_part_00
MAWAYLAVTDLYFRADGYYTCGQLDGLSDADQRIAEDIPKLCQTLAALFPGLVKPLVDISWYSVRMWQLTGRTGLLVLYGYMFFGLGALRLIGGGSPTRASPARPLRACCVRPLLQFI